MIGYVLNNNDDPVYIKFIKRLENANYFLITTMLAVY